MFLHYEPVPSPEEAPAGLAPAEPMFLHYEPVPSPEEAPAGLAPAEPMLLHYRVTLLRGSRRGAGLVEVQKHCFHRGEPGGERVRRFGLLVQKHCFHRGKPGGELAWW